GELLAEDPPDGPRPPDADRVGHRVDRSRTRRERDEHPGGRQGRPDRPRHGGQDRRPPAVAEHPSAPRTRRSVHPERSAPSTTTARAPFRVARAVVRSVLGPTAQPQATAAYGASSSTTLPPAPTVTTADPAGTDVARTANDWYALASGATAAK